MKFETSIDRRMASRNKMCLAVNNDYKNKKVLDIGCSYGWFEKFVDAKEIVGIELEEKDLMEAKRDVRSSEDKKIRFEIGDVLSLKFIDNSFDRVVMFDVIEHLPKGKEKKAIKEIKRVLKEKGKLIISTPANNFSKLFDPAWYFGHRHYSVDKIKRILGEDFKVEKAVIRGRFFDILGLLLFYPFKWILNSEIPLKEWFDKKRDKEYLENRDGFVTLYVVARKLAQDGK